MPIRRGGSESNLDVVNSVGDDGVGLDFTKGALGINSLQQKILKVRGNSTGGFYLQNKTNNSLCNLFKYSQAVQYIHVLYA